MCAIHEVGLFFTVCQTSRGKWPHPAKTETNCETANNLKGLRSQTTSSVSESTDQSSLKKYVCFCQKCQHSLLNVQQEFISYKSRKIQIHSVEGASRT